MTGFARRCYQSDNSSIADIASRLGCLLAGKKPVILCIGTEFVAGDSLGPCVGSQIMREMKSPVFVYGTQGSNVNAINLQLAAQLIKLLHPDNPLLVIDAAVGGDSEVGMIYLYEGGIMPGAATNKNLPKIGDISLLGVVSQKGLDDFYMLRRTKQQLVNKIANVIASAIVHSNAQSAW